MSSCWVVPSFVPEMRKLWFNCVLMHVEAATPAISPLLAQEAMDPLAPVPALAPSSLVSNTCGASAESDDATTTESAVESASSDCGPCNTVDFESSPNGETCAWKIEPKAAYRALEARSPTLAWNSLSP